ncbi:hypothetical protein DEU56DRAFT_211646 [Suillus clintonianus]|uniref:uncharacterized protein n=1 Tax=Suillus clintonianus TaxID=1904413 RepID=UPI001B882DE3|nr:uncharacterized protein DEU56DRAFT_211646 [Suillus clintonianus]KAG2111756.1 hypothetical protein DEU56DRAFT_211646 [Suillus clintonianus]
MYLQKSKSLQTTPMLMSSSRLGHAPDQGLMKSMLQSYLECLDRRNDRLNIVYKEILEIRARIAEIHTSCQLEVAVGDEGALDSSVHLQAIVDDWPRTIMTAAFDELNVISQSLTPLELSILEEKTAFQGQLSDLEYGPSESTITLPEGADLLQEIRTHITELLASVQSEVTMPESGIPDNSAYPQSVVGDEPQTIASFALDELNDISPLLTSLGLPLLPKSLAFHGQLSDQWYGPFNSVGDMGSLPEDADPPFGQRSQDRDTAGFISHQFGAQSFPHQHDIYPEGQTFPGSSSIHDQQLPLPIVQVSHKVKCTWPGCTRFLQKDSLTRHVNETHRRKVKAVCADCGRKFTRRYLKTAHICRAKM